MPSIRRPSLLVLALAAAPVLAAQKQVTLTVPTMDCATCPVTIKVALMKVPGVSKAVVSYKHRTALVTFDDAKADVAALTRATDAAGYPSFPADPR
jgi:mercuric ion binding protein